MHILQVPGIVFLPIPEGPVLSLASCSSHSAKSLVQSSVVAWWVALHGQVYRCELSILICKMPGRVSRLQDAIVKVIAVHLGPNDMPVHLLRYAPTGSVHTQQLML